MIDIGDDFKVQYVSAKPTRVAPLGSINALYLPRFFVQSFIFHERVVYPTIAPYKGNYCVAFFFNKPPKEYLEKSYKIYRLKRNKKICIYLPVPKQVSVVLGNLRKCLLNYYFGKDSNNQSILVLVRLENER